MPVDGYLLCWSSARSDAVSPVEVRTVTSDKTIIRIACAVGSSVGSIYETTQLIKAGTSLRMRVGGSCGIWLVPLLK